VVTYAELGIRPVINGWGTLTSIGGSTLPLEVLDAMAEAASQYVPMSELHEAAGCYIAERLGVEAAFITSGASAGMTLAAAACVAGMDPVHRAQLPDIQGLKEEIVVFRCMRSNYDQAFRLAGIKFVEIGMPKRTESWELERVISPNTAAVAYIVEHEYSGGLSLETILPIVHDRNVPVIVDAAAELPPVNNLWAYANKGVDLTIFSGGKDIRGPQSTGLIVGRKDLIDACVYHSCPNHSIGRGMKVGKEEIMGFLTALDIYLKQDFTMEMKNWEAQVAYIIDVLSAVPGLTAKRVMPSEPGIQPVCIPRVYVEWTSTLSKRNQVEIQQDLMEGNPRIAVGTSSNAIVINPQMLEENQEYIIAECIKRLFLNDSR